MNKKDIIKRILSDIEIVCHKAIDLGTQADPFDIIYETLYTYAQYVSLPKADLIKESNKPKFDKVKVDKKTWH